MKLIDWQTEQRLRAMDSEDRLRLLTEMSKLVYKGEVKTPEAYAQAVNRQIPGELSTPVDDGDLL